VAGYALISVELLYDLYRNLAAGLELLPLRVGFNVAVLLVPTSLMGLSLPLVARAVTTAVRRAGTEVGRYVSSNTLGAALGAATGGWILLGSQGFERAIQFAAAVEVVAAVCFLGLARSLRRRSPVEPEMRAPSQPIAATGERPAPDTAVWGWYLAYAGTGAVALGFEQVFFRLIDGVMRSNSYTFAHVLSMYLLLLAVGTAAGSLVRPRVRDDRRAFLWIQFGVGASAVLALVLVTRVLPVWPLEESFATWFNSDGFAGGFGDSTAAQRLLFGLVLPLVLMGLPVLLMGAAFPFVQGIVTRDLERVGRRTGTLIFANLVGNVSGALLTSFVLIEHLGTIGAYLVLLAPLAVAGVLAARLGSSSRWRPVAMAAVLVLVVSGAVLLPSNDRLWATLHGTTVDSILVAEDRSCASAVEDYGDDRYQLTINGAGQNGYPFDDFHVLIGLLPALAHDDPERALAVGLGIGSTSDSMLISDRIDEVVTVELCGGNYELVDRLADRGIPAFERLRDDERHTSVVGDGRRHLLVTDDTYDIVVPDTLRPNSAGSGNLYSLEFQELVDERLADDGLTVGWFPTYRSLNSVTLTFPHVVTLTVPTYNNSPFYVASRSPIRLDPEVLLERFDALAADALPADQRERLRSFIASIEPVCVNDGDVPPRPTADLLNVDLWPRDEYFLSNGGIGEEQVARSC
jgi:spermidine synthase